MEDAGLIATWEREERQPLVGWDFSYLDGRVLGEPAPWSYETRAAELMRRARSVLDLDTGGGERLLTLRPDWPVAVVATESYPPNLTLATERLAPLGVQVVDAESDERVALPFGDASFDLVLNRHGGLNIAEIARVLAPGGRAVVTATNRFAFRDPHYHLRGINWLPRPWAEALIRRRGRGKDAAAFADRQALAAMHYVTFGGFAARCRRLGFAVEDTRERRVRSGPLGGRRFAAPIRLLRRLGLAVPAYRLYRSLFLGTFEVCLTRNAERGTTRGGRLIRERSRDIT